MTLARKIARRYPAGIFRFVYFGSVMDFDRRQFLALGLLAAELARGAQHSYAMSRMPNASTFESGDLLWPKKPGAIIPYSEGGNAASDGDKQDWLHARDSCLEKLKADQSPYAVELRSALSKLSYEEFKLRYLEDKKPGQLTTYAGGNIGGVGHVGIVDIDPSGTPFVIEALLDAGVTRASYADWVKSRNGDLVWHGRLKDVDKRQRAALRTEAAKHVGTQYDFFNFDLNDDAGFYCSKLVWMSIFRALDIAVDDNSTTKRSFWFSPKQLLYTARVLRLHDPGEYATR